MLKNIADTFRVAQGLVEIVACQATQSQTGKLVKRVDVQAKQRWLDKLKYIEGQEQDDKNKEQTQQRDLLYQETSVYQQPDFEQAQIAQQQDVSNPKIEVDKQEISSLQRPPTTELQQQTQETQQQQPQSKQQINQQAKKDIVYKQNVNELRERSVPSSQYGRAFGFAQMGANLAFGAASEGVQRFMQGSKNTQEGQASSFMSERSADIIASGLCRMRGAALKLGQMLSLQDEHILPPQISKALDKVRQGADMMPKKQLEKVLKSELGEEWRSLFQEFDYKPIAAASIGQVHKAQMKDGREIAMKVQYPGVAQSIESDVDNLMMIINMANVLPKGMYIQQAIDATKKELALECDYVEEAKHQIKYKQLLQDERDLSQWFSVPSIIQEASSKRVISSEYIKDTIPIDQVLQFDQETRNMVGARLLTLTLTELFKWRFMQTDPNWGNFLYHPPTQITNLIDFGASRTYPKPFVDEYIRMVKACGSRDKDEVVKRSINMGFLTGDESKQMTDAHCEAAYTVGIPLGYEGVYDFKDYSKNLMTKRVTDMGQVMLKHRLTAPPQESYSLHRRLSGAFLSLMKLKAQVPCSQIFNDIYQSYDFGQYSNEDMGEYDNILQGQQEKNRKGNEYQDQHSKDHQKNQVDKQEPSIV